MARGHPTVLPSKEPAPPAAPSGARGRPAGAPARGRQYLFALSPDGVLRAFSRDRNLWLSDARGIIEMRPSDTDWPSRKST